MVGLFLLWSTVILLIGVVMQVCGIGIPNCEPTIMGYAIWYLTLFGAASLSVMLFVGLLVLSKSVKRLLVRS